MVFSPMIETSTTFVKDGYFCLSFQQWLCYDICRESDTHGLSLWSCLLRTNWSSPLKVLSVHWELFRLVSVIFPVHIYEGCLDFSYNFCHCSRPRLYGCCYIFHFYILYQYFYRKNQWHIIEDTLLSCIRPNLIAEYLKDTKILNVKQCSLL